MSAGVMVNGYVSLCDGLLNTTTNNNNDHHHHHRNKLMTGCGHRKAEPRVVESLCSEYMNFTDLHRNKLTVDEC